MLLYSLCCSYQAIVRDTISGAYWVIVCITFCICLINASSYNTVSWSYHMCITDAGKGNKFALI